jgi:predicted DNA-binding ribbon-helix-helix protein
MPRKTEVYTWRVSASTKTSLEEAARNTNRSVAQLLDEIVAEHLSTSDPTSDAEVDHQRRLHARAARFLGCMSSGVARRSERTRELVRARLNRRRAHAR